MFFMTVMAVAVIMMFVVMMPRTDGRAGDIVANGNRQQFPEIPEPPASGPTGTDMAGQTREDQQCEQTSDDLQHHELGDLKIVKPKVNDWQIGSVPAFPAKPVRHKSRDFEMVRIPNMVKHVVVISSHVLKYRFSDLPVASQPNAAASEPHLPNNQLIFLMA
jgi:hypothetical protein